MAANDPHDHNGHRKRLRERFFAEGLDHFQPHEVLEMMLTYVIPRRDTKPIAKELIRTFGSLPEVLEADPAKLQQVAGIGENAAAFLALLPQLSRYYLTARQAPRPVLSSRKEMGEYLVGRMAGFSKEVLLCLSLDRRLRLICCDVIAEGEKAAVRVDARKIVDLALRHDAEIIVLAHNHPSGCAVASPADVEVTACLRQTLAPLRIKLADHLIIAGDEYAGVPESIFELREDESITYTYGEPY